MSQPGELLGLANDVADAASDAPEAVVYAQTDVDLRAVFNGRVRWVAACAGRVWTDDTPERALRGLAAGIRGSR